MRNNENKTESCACVFHFMGKISCWIQKFSNDLIAFIARFGIAATFWLSGQTKVDGFKLNFFSGDFELGLPKLSESVVSLFADEYKLPILPSDIAAIMAASAEHIFPILLLIGLATRFSALALLGMTAVIQVFVYPDAYATHATWAACLLFLMAQGAGRFSLDYVFWGRKTAH